MKHLKSIPVFQLRGFFRHSSQDVHTHTITYVCAANQNLSLTLNNDMNHFWNLKYIYLFFCICRGYCSVLPAALLMFKVFQPCPNRKRNPINAGKIYLYIFTASLGMPHCSPMRVWGGDRGERRPLFRLLPPHPHPPKPNSHKWQKMMDGCNNIAASL